MDFSTIKVTLKKVSRNTVDISTREITLNILKNVNGNNVDFWTIEITAKKVRENNMVFSTSKLHRKKYVETTWIFGSAKLRRKSTWKLLGNLSKFTFCQIGVISTSDRRRFDVVCPLG